MSRASRGTVWQRCTTCGRKTNGAARDGHAASGCEGTRTSWAFRVSLGRGADGRRNQLMRSGFATAADATRALRELLTKVELDPNVRSDRRTVADYLDEWLAATRPPRVVASTHAKRTLHARYVTPRIGRLALEDVTPAVLDRLYQQLLRDGRLDGAGGLAVTTVRDLHRTLSKAWSDARRWGYLGPHVNPFANADPPGLDKVDDRRRAAMAVWTAAELHRFLEATAEHPLGPLFHLAAATGLRRSELLGLRWSDLDLDRGRLRVAQKCVRGERGWQLVQSAKTRAGARVIALDTATVAILRRHYDQPPPAGQRRGHGLVFTRPDGRHLSPSTVTRTFRQLVDDLELPRIVLHGLRHSHATALHMRGVASDASHRRMCNRGVALI